MNRTLKAAVVGGGPSGFYAAEALMERLPGVEVDVLDRLPVPFGLVRYGVAPDHPQLKSVTKVFEGIAQQPGFRFFGNVAMGRDVSVDDLSSLYDVVIVATGASGDRRLGVPGEDLPGVRAARDFVAWYNGLPEAADFEFDLSQEVAVVVGQGNVAIDVCRILAKPVDELRKTDIAAHALEALSQSRVREIHLVGRRGPVQARFTTKELRELGHLKGWRPVVDPRALALGEACRAELAHPTNGSVARNFALLQEFSQRPANDDKPLHIRFFTTPTALQGQDHLESVVLETQRLSGEPFQQVAQGTGQFEALAAGLLLRSVGYLGTAPAGLPFDARKGTVLHRDGRIVDAQGVPMRGWFTTGWIKRGPSGVIGTNRADSIATVESLLQDVDTMDIGDKPGRDGLHTLLAQRGVRPVGFEQWHAIEACERERGLPREKTAEKLVRIDEMLEVAFGR